MKRKIVSEIMVTLLLIGMLTLAFNIQPVKAEAKTWYVDDDGGADFTKIQNAINAASSGDTIYVYNGTYYENVVVNKTVFLVGENKNATIIDGGENLEAPAVKVIANNVIFRGFTTRTTLNGIGPRPYNILLNGTANTVIADNNIAGEDSNGIGAYMSTNITVTGNNITVGNIGVHLFGSSYVSVAENNMEDNRFAVQLYKSFNNTVTDNNLTEMLTGIWLSESFNNTIAGNSISGELLHDNLTYDDSPYLGVGIEMQAFGPPYAENGSSYNTFYENDIRNCYAALVMSYYGGARHHNNVFLRNNIANNYKGVDLEHCFNFTFKDNTLSENVYNLGVYGLDLLDYIHDIDTSNMVNGKPVYYLINQRNLTINPSTSPDVGYLALINSTNITVENLNLRENLEGLLMVSTKNSQIINNNITNNELGIYLDMLSFNNTISGNNVTDQDGIGVWLGYSFNNTLIGNVVSNNRPGIRLYGSFNNTLTCNTIANNSRGGVWLDYSSSNVIVSNTIANNTAEMLSDAGVSLYLSYVNKIFHNNFINNQRQAYASPGNIWDDGYPSGGNYWSNHVCTGNPNDGSQPYVIDANNIDHYPFQDPNGWLLKLEGDVNSDGIVNINDVVIAALAFGSSVGEPNLVGIPYDPKADLNNDGKIDIIDLVIIGINFGKRW